MRISDWSSDVCSSDLSIVKVRPMGAGITRSSPPCAHLCVDGGIRPAGPPIRSPRPMRRDEIDQDLRNLAFDFFYWFSRFEFALKERRFLKTEAIGARAKPDWDKFVQKHRDAYALSPAAQALLRSEEPTSELQSLMRNSYAVFCFQTKKHHI